MSIGKRIIEAREALGWNQQTLAKVLEVRRVMTQQALSALETERSTNTRKLVALAQVLEVRAEWLQDGRLPMRNDDAGRGVIQAAPAPLAPLIARLLSLHEQGRLPNKFRAGLEEMLAALDMPSEE